MDGGASIELPKYQSHKTVRALKIVAVWPQADGSVTLQFDFPYGPMKVPEAYVVKHAPQPGGYWVRYDDGYESWSPAEAFEGGYTRV